jgi:glycosyltransferase involved in cell wall biosynthesis
VIAPSSTHLVLIPSYNTGSKLCGTVADACRFWNPVWVVLDGSTDGSDVALALLAKSEPGLRIFVLPENRGKGAALLHGVEAALSEGYTHALTMDADGQHPVSLIPFFMTVSRENPQALILGKPVFDETAPPSRLRGRRISNWWANLETLWCGIGDSLLGFRVYPLTDLRMVMDSVVWMRRFDFDPEAAVRLCWRGLRPINLAAPTRYFRPEEGGVSHFRYGRDNVLLTWMHVRLMLGFLWRLPVLLRRRLTASRH